MREHRGLFICVSPRKWLTLQYRNFKIFKPIQNRFVCCECYCCLAQFVAQLAPQSEIAVTMQLSTAQMIAIMVAIVVIMSRVFSSIYVGFYGLLSAKLIVILHLAKTFSEKNRPNSCAFQSYCITLPSLQFIDADSPHNLRARIYVQARPTFFIKVVGLFFCP